MSFNLYILAQRTDTMFSNSSKYAIKGVLYLAVNASETNKILAKDIAKPINVPPSYIAKLLQELGRHGIVSSVKGRYGGFYLLVLRSDFVVIGFGC